MSYYLLSLAIFGFIWLSACFLFTVIVSSIIYIRWLIKVIKRSKNNDENIKR